MFELNSSCFKEILKVFWGVFINRYFGLDIVVEIKDKNCSLGRDYFKSLWIKVEKLSYRRIVCKGILSIKLWIKFE